jgi:hypothetical protein
VKTVFTLWTRLGSRTDLEGVYEREADAWAAAQELVREHWPEWPPLECFVEQEDVR